MTFAVSRAICFHPDASLSWRSSRAAVDDAFGRDLAATTRRIETEAENFTFANTLGREMYVQPIFGRDRKWWRMEITSYPLFICARREVLMTGRQGA
jgi:hypothetical protein